MTRRGRPAKALTRHIADGTFQPCRHEERLPDGVFGGQPVLPPELEQDPEARNLWATLITTVPPPILAGADAPELVMLCRLWSEWRKVDRALVRLAPTNKKYGGLLKHSLGLCKAWNSIACRFGLTPADRAKLRGSAGKPAGPADPLSGLLAQRKPQ